MEELLGNDPSWGADRLHRNVLAHDDSTVRRGVEEWESNPRLFPLGNFDGAMITMGSSPRFPMYDNDFGWGQPIAVRSGRTNKFDGKISAFPGREGNGSVDLEVVLAPETMAGLKKDVEFMQYVSSILTDSILVTPPEAPPSPCTCIMNIGQNLNTLKRMQDCSQISSSKTEKKNLSREGENK